jgi:RNA-binding protein
VSKKIDPARIATKRAAAKRAAAKPDAAKKDAAGGPLTGSQRRHLRGLGHHLDPVVQIGKLGLTDSVIAAVDEALERHELVKVRVGTECPEDRHELAARLAPVAKGQLAQVLGRTMLLYRRHPSEAKIQLPKG